MITDIEGMLSKTAVHLEVWSTLSPNLVSNMERGVVFIYASWSGYAKASLLTLARVAAVTNAPFSLAIVNHDAVDPDSFESVLSMFPTGQGETFAVKRGVLGPMIRSYGADSELVSTFLKSSGIV